MEQNMETYVLLMIVAFCVFIPCRTETLECKVTKPGLVVTLQPVCEELCQFSNSSEVCNNWKNFYNLPKHLRPTDMVFLCCLGIMLEWVGYPDPHNVYEMYDPLADIPTYDLYELFSLNLDTEESASRLASCIRCVSTFLSFDEKRYVSHYAFYLEPVKSCMNNPGMLFSC